MSSPLDAAIAARLERWTDERVTERLWQRDGSLWAESGAAGDEVTAWLGWLDLPERMADRAGEIASLAAAVAADGYQRAAVLGMGGSSLAPDLFATLPGTAELRICDSTHPDAVRPFRAWATARRTLLCVSSKSGTTAEPLAFHAALADELPALDFVAITDPGTPLADLAAAQGFRAIVTGEPDVGGRYSALSVFGLLPAALHGIDLDTVLAGARRMADACRDPGPANPGLALAAFLVEVAAAGQDKLTILAAPGLAVLGDWIEQLVAESLGKHGRGILPVVGEGPAAAADYRNDRAVVVLGDLDVDLPAGTPVLGWAVDPARDLGAEFVRWQVATAVAGIGLAVNPFDQPNVAEAKAATAAALAAPAAVRPTADPSKSVDDLIGLTRPGDYLAILAFLPPTPEVHAALEALRAELRARTGLAVTVGIGPRYLHSTGQLHKGGPDTGAFLVLTADPQRDLPIPGQDHTFGQLIAAQAAGDLATLERHGRRVRHLHFADALAGLGAIMASAL